MVGKANITLVKIGVQMYTLHAIPETALCMWLTMSNNMQMMNNNENARNSNVQ